MIDEDFSSGNSIMHRLDPRIKIIVAFAFSVTVALSDHFPAVLSAIFIALFFIFLARLPFRKVCSRLLIVNGLILLLWLFIPFALAGKEFIRFGPLIATKEGIIYSALITIKSNSIIMVLMALISTMTVFTLGRAMRHLHVPAKIVHLLLFTYRYIHAIHREYVRQMNTIKIRGFRPGTNIHTYRTYAYLVGMLLVKSHDRAERVRAAMLCRGFKGKLYDLSELSLSPSDLCIMLFMLLAVAGVGLLQWTRIIY